METRGTKRILDYFLRDVDEHGSYLKVLNLNGTFLERNSCFLRSERTDELCTACKETKNDCATNIRWNILSD